MSAESSVSRPVNQGCRVEYVDPRARAPAASPSNPTCDLRPPIGAPAARRHRAQRLRRSWRRRLKLSGADWRSITSLEIDPPKCAERDDQDGNANVEPTRLATHEAAPDHIGSLEGPNQAHQQDDDRSHVRPQFHIIQSSRLNRQAAPYPGEPLQSASRGAPRPTVGPATRLELRAMTHGAHRG